jgi:hypothetical protein
MTIAATKIQNAAAPRFIVFLLLIDSLNKDADYSKTDAPEAIFGCLIAFHIK